MANSPKSQHIRPNLTFGNARAAGLSLEKFDFLMFAQERQNHDRVCAAIIMIIRREIGELLHWKEVEDFYQRNKEIRASAASSMRQARANIRKQFGILYQYGVEACGYAPYDDDAEDPPAPG